jgi:uncharacterized protein YdaU (DUF1376 family)
MSQAPAMPVFTDALIGDTTHLSTEEFGAYCLILFATWRNSGMAFPDDDRRMARICRVSEARWMSKLRSALAGFFDLSNKTWRQKRLEKEWNFVAEKVRTNRENGKRGGRPKPLTNNDPPKPNGSVPVAETKTERLSTHTHTQEDSEASASAMPPDPVKHLFDGILRILGPKGRALAGKLRKEYGDVAVLEAVAETERECPSDPASYLIGCCKRRKGDGSSHARDLDILGQAALDAEQSQGGSGDYQAAGGSAWGAEELGDGGATLHRLPVRYSA